MRVEAPICAVNVMLLLSVRLMQTGTFFVSF